MLGGSSSSGSMHSSSRLLSSKTGLEPSSISTPATQSSMDRVANLSKTSSLALLTLISATYGTNFTAIKTMGDAGLDASFSALVRFFIACVIFSPAVFRVGFGVGGANKQSDTPASASLTAPLSPPQARLDILSGAFQVGLLNGVGYLAQSFALKSGSTSTTAVAFIACLSVVVVPVLDSLLASLQVGSLKFEPRKYYPALLALAGVAILELLGTDGGAAGATAAAASPPSLADNVPYFGSTALAASFMQPLFFGLAFKRLERVIQRCTQPEHFLAFTGANQFAVFTLSCLSFAVLPDSRAAGLDLWSRLSEQASLLGGTPVLFSLLWTGLVTTAGCSLFEGFAMKQLTSAEVTVIYSSEPLFATLFAALFLGETVGINTAVGAVLIIWACLLSGSAAPDKDKKTSD